MLNGLPNNFTQIHHLVGLMGTGNLRLQSGNVDFVNTVYRNVVGVLPTPQERDFYVSLLQGSGGTMTQADLLVLAANSAQNEVNIDLVGMQQTGVEFLP